MPVSVGIAPTKTLAKLANRTAKKIPKFNGVCVLNEPYKWEWVQRRVPVTAIWGIAKRMAARLDDLTIRTAWDLATANPKIVRSKTNVCVERTMAELNGVPCLALDEVPPAKKQIYCTRSFGHKATSLQPVLEGLSLYAARAAEKLRAQKHLALAVHVFIHTSPFKPNFHSASDVAQLPYPTDDTRVITSVVRRLGAKLFKKGHEYLKAGVGLIEVIDKRYYQHDLLHPGQSEQADRLMAVMDRINHREGRDTIFLAAQGVRTPWSMRQQFRSPQYTTRWSDIPVVHTDL